MIVGCVFMMLNMSMYRSVRTPPLSGANRDRIFDFGLYQDGRLPQVRNLLTRARAPSRGGANARAQAVFVDEDEGQLGHYAESGAPIAEVAKVEDSKYA